jgi:hypothetical protein
LDVFRRWHGAAELDDEFAAKVADARDGASVEEDADPWLD